MRDVGTGLAVVFDNSMDPDVFMADYEQKLRSWQSTGVRKKVLFDLSGVSVLNVTLANTLRRCFMNLRALSLATVHKVVLFISNSGVGTFIRAVLPTGTGEVPVEICTTRSAAAQAFKSP